MRFEVAAFLSKKLGGHVVRVPNSEYFSLESPEGGWPQEWCEKVRMQLREMRLKGIRIRPANHP